MHFLYCKPPKEILEHNFQLCPSIHDLLSATLFLFQKCNLRERYILLQMVHEIYHQTDKTHHSFLLFCQEGQVHDQHFKHKYLNWISNSLKVT